MMNVIKKRDITKGSVDKIPELDYEDSVPSKEGLFKDHRELTLSSAKVGNVLVSNNINYTFVLPRLEDHFFDPSSLVIDAVMALMKADGVTEIENEQNVAVISSLIPTVFQRLDIYSMGQLVRSYTQFGLQSYILALLNTPRKEVESSLKHFNGMTIDEGIIVGGDDDTLLSASFNENANHGLYQRKLNFGYSAENDFSAELKIPLFSHGKLLPLNSQFRLEFYLNSNDYCVMKSPIPKTLETPQLVIKHMDLKLQIYELQEKARLAIERPMKTKNQGLALHFQDQELHTFSIPKGSLQFNSGPFVSLPARLFVVAFLNESAFYGDPVRSPHIWKSIYLQQLELQVDEKTSALKQDFTDRSHILDAFRKVQALLPLEPSESVVNYDFFTKTPIYLFDVTPSGRLGNDIELFPEKWVNASQNWCLKGKMAEETKQNLIGIVVREVDRKLIFDHNYIARVE